MKSSYATPPFKMLALLLAGFLATTAIVNAQTARVQVIHNSADAAADSVDVWLNNTLLLNNFAFRTATPFVNAPAGVPIELRVKGKTSTDTANALYKTTVTLTANTNYVIVASGIVSGSGYNPATPFDLHISAAGRLTANTPGNTDVLVFHGSTDAPIVDVAETSVPAGVIVPAINYGEFAGYLELGTADYRLAVQDTGNTTTVASYDAPLSSLSLDDSAIVVVASGFLNPANNSNGPGFGLYVALAQGGNLIALPDATGINDFKRTTRLTGYPNPVEDLFTLQTGSDFTGDLNVKVYDMKGAIVLERNLVNQGGSRAAINVSALHKGAYIVKTTGQGKTGIAQMIKH